jgi:hypothetical protein
VFEWGSSSVAWLPTVKKMIVWGGGSEAGTSSEGWAYDLGTNAWSALPAPPTILAQGRRNHVAVGAGARMLVWGGRDMTGNKDSGAIYDALTNAWIAVAKPNLAPRIYAASGSDSVGGRAVVWGGSDPVTPYADGAVLNLAAGTWEPLPVSPLAARVAYFVSTGGAELATFGGVAGGVFLKDGAFLDVTAKRWTVISTAPATIAENAQAVAANGRELFVFGGETVTDTRVEPVDTGAIFREKGGWTPIPRPPVSALRQGKVSAAVAFWAAGKYWVWGGRNVIGGATSPSADGASFDVATSTWNSMPTSPLSGRAVPAVVQTGEAVLLFGGNGNAGSLRDGALFVP